MLEIRIHDVPKLLPPLIDKLQDGEAISIHKQSGLITVSTPIGMGSFFDRLEALSAGAPLGTLDEMLAWKAEGRP